MNPKNSKAMMYLKQKKTFTLLVLLFIVFACSNPNGNELSVSEGEFTQTVTETGELAAVNVRSFVMQRYGRYWYQMKIIGLLEHGTVVQPGDSIIQFDPSNVQRFIIDRENDLEIQRANLEKTLVDIDNRFSELNSNLKNEEAGFELKKLEMEQFKFESEKTQKIKELEFKQAQIRLDKVKKSLEYYKVISNNQLHIQKIRVDRIETEIKNAYDVLSQLTVRTTIPGIFQVARKRRSREHIMIGDEVYVGNALGNVPDLTWMKVNTVVNEADFMKVHLGQKVNVRLDALPEVVFEGEVTKVSRLSRPIEWNSRRKVFDVEVKMLVSDQRLKPGMTVSCEYICAHFDNVLYAPLQCVDKIESRYFVYVKDGNGHQKVEISVGPANSSSIVVRGNIEKGQKLLPVSEIYQTLNN